MILQLSILNALTIGPEFDNSLLGLLKEIQENTHLTKLVLVLTPLESSDDLRALSQFILRAKGLTSLKVTFRDFMQERSLDSFIEELKGCLNLSSLSLDFN